MLHERLVVLVVRKGGNALKRRPLLSFTVCWITGSVLACLFTGGRLLMLLAVCLLLLGACAVGGRLGLRYTVVLGLALAAAVLYWEWSEGRNISRLPEVLAAPAAELHESQVKAEGTIVSPVERDGDRIDFTLKLSGIRRSDDGSAQEVAAGSEVKSTDAPDKRMEELEASGRQDGKVSGELVAVQIRLQAESEIAAAAQWRRGDTVQLNGELEIPSVARNFGGFDYRDYLLTKKIHWLLKGEGTASMQAEPPIRWQFSSVLRWNDGVRAVLGAEIDRLFQEPHAGYMKGLVIGIQEDLDPETFKQFSQLGLTHILAISGMHVAVYVGVLLFILRRFRLTRETVITVTLLLVPLYVLLSGAGPSVVRAGIMSMIALLAARFGLLKDGMNILAAAALIMLVWNPYLLLSVSFQLSFLVTAGLMVYTPLTAPLFRRLPKWLGGSVTVTLIAQLVSFPLTVYYFNQFSLLSFAANLLLVPFITFLVLPLGTLALLLSRFWDGAALALADFAELLNKATFAAVEWVNGLPAGVLIWVSPSLLWICLYYALLYGLLYALKRRAAAILAPQYMEDETRPLAELEQQNSRGDTSTSRPMDRGGDIGNGRSIGRGIGRLTGRGGSATLAPRPFSLPASLRWSGPAAVLCAAGIALLLYRGYYAEKLDGAGTISYLDVGQGDSILITTPAGAHILVDGGGTLSFGKKEEWRIRRSPFEIGAKTLVPLLKKRGIHRLDAVILTHGDQDHAGGLQAVLEEIPVSALLFNGTLAEREPYRKLMDTALTADVRLYGVHQGMVLAPDKETELFFLWPEAQADGHATLREVEEQNHESVVFRLEMNGRSFLFTGDMDKAAEEDIVADARLAGIDSGSPVDVLKVAHHGSKTSTGTAWLEFWNPRAAAVSAGVNNMYGHPNGDVLERLTGSGTTIYRTDLHGEIQLKVRREGIGVRHKLKKEPTQ